MVCLTSVAFGEGPSSSDLALDRAITAYYAGDDETALTLSLQVLAAIPAHPAAQALRHSITEDRADRRTLHMIDQRRQLLNDLLAQLSRRSKEHPADAALAVERRQLETACQRRQAEGDRLLTRYTQPVEEALERGELLRANLVWHQLHHVAPTAPSTTQMQAILVTALQERLAESDALPPHERFLLDGWLAYHRGSFDAAAQEWGKAQALARQGQTSIPWEEVMALPMVHAQLQQRARATAAEQERVRQTRMQAEAMQRTAREAAIRRLLREGRQASLAGRWREAAYAFQEVLKLAPNHPKASDSLARVQATLARDHDPQEAESHYQAGLVAYAHRQLEQARHEWELALRLAPDHPKAQRALEKAQRELALR